MADRRSNDEQYKRALGDRFQSLREEDRQKVVACIPKESCRSLADDLLPNEEMMAALNRQDVPYPASEIINVWTKKCGSTIYVLKATLEKLHLEAAVKTLEKAREDLVSLHTRISDEFRTFTVPSEKPLIEIIRPHIHRKQCVVSNQVIQVIQLVLKTDAERELTWSSPAKHFKGQQVNIKVEVRKLEEIKAQRHTDKAGNLEERFTVDRNAISVIEDDRLVFDYDYDDDDDDNDEGDYFSSLKVVRCVERLSSRISRASVAESNVCEECEQRSLRGNDAIQAESTTICQCIDLSSEDTLKDHLTAEGDFVVQQIQSDGRATLNLSVRHGDQILRYPIMTQHDNEGSKQFSISGAGDASTDVDQLLKHYQPGGHSLPVLPSLPPTQVEEDPVYLKRERNLPTPTAADSH